MLINLSSLLLENSPLRIIFCQRTESISPRKPLFSYSNQTRRSILVPLGSHNRNLPSPQFLNTDGVSADFNPPHHSLLIFFIEHETNDEDFRSFVTGCLRKQPNGRPHSGLHPRDHRKSWPRVQ